MPWLFTLVWLGLAADGGHLDERALSQTLDAIVTRHLQDTGVPGVVVTVTEGPRVVVARGWGAADLDADRPMDPDRTLVRIASVSKTFTATAVAQLEDADELDIDADVDRYLAHLSTRSRRFDAPVTVRHLLAHTSGFINYNSGRVSRQPPQPEDFEGFIARTMPPRMHPPSTAILYTNHGNALAGLVVQDVAGVPFAQYVQTHIFDPLGMSKTTYSIDPAHEDLARSYAVDDAGNATPWLYEYFLTIPASTVHTTATDMAPYLMLHAGDGRVHDRRVLSPDAMRRMRTPHATIHPALPEYHYAFAPAEILGHRARVHGGSVPAFLSRMVVFDDAGVGVFVAQNAFGPDVFTEVIEAVAAALPSAGPGPPVQPAGDGKPHNPDALVGSYRVLDKHETAAFTRAMSVLAQAPLIVGLDEEGFLVVDGNPYLRTGDLVFEPRDGDGGDTVVFVRDADDAVAWLHQGRRSAFRPAWHLRRELQVTAHVIALGLVMAGLLGTMRSRTSRRGLWAALAVAAIVGAVGPQLFALVADRGQPIYTRPLRFGTPVWIDAVRWLPRLAAVVGLVLVLRRGTRHGPGLCVTLGAAALVVLDLVWRTPPPGLPPA